LRCKNCYATLKSGASFCEYCGTAIVLNKSVGQKTKKNGREKGDNINEQMRNYEGSPEYQKMIRGEQVKKEPTKKKSSKGNPFAIIKFSDLSKVYELLIFSEMLEQNRKNHVFNDYFLYNLSKMIIKQVFH